MCCVCLCLYHITGKLWFSVHCNLVLAGYETVCMKCDKSKSVTSSTTCHFRHLGWLCIHTVFVMMTLMIIREGVVTWHSPTAIASNHQPQLGQEVLLVPWNRCDQIIELLILACSGIWLQFPVIYKPSRMIAKHVTSHMQAIFSEMSGQTLSYLIMVSVIMQVTGPALSQLDQLPSVGPHAWGGPALG